MMNKRLVHSETKAMPQAKKALFFTIFFLVPLVFAFAVAEFYVRIVRPEIDLWIITGRKIGPNPMVSEAFVDAFSAYRGRPGKYGNKTINGHGFISTPELTIAKPTGTIRIVFLGGSSTAGTGWNLADADTWPWQASQMLRNRFRGKKIEFINGALDGYTSFESYGRFWSRIRFFSPDIIVIYHGWNEMYYFNMVDKMTSWRMLSDGSWTLDRTDKPVAIYEPMLIDYLIRPSQVLIRLRLRLSSSQNGELGSKDNSKALAKQYDQRGLDVWRTNLRLFRETAKLLGVELFVAKQATLIVADLPLEQQQRCHYDFHGFDHAAHMDAFQQIYRVIDEEIPVDHIIDATPLSGNPAYFYDHIHPTEKGASKIAEVVTNVLLRYLMPRYSD